MRRYGLVDIPDQASDIDAVPITRTITINGTTFDLSADRTYTVGGMAIGGTVTSGTTGSVLFIGASSALAQDNANFFWDDTNNRLGIGTSTPSVPFEVYSASTTNRGLTITQATSDILAPPFTGRKIRGTSAVASGDFLFNFNASGYDGTNYQTGSAIRWAVDSAVSTGSVPTSIEFRTGSSGLGTERLTISSSGNITFIGTSFTNRFTATGRLLLGTTTESTYILDVVGSARVTSTSTSSTTSTYSIIGSSNLTYSSGASLTGGIVINALQGGLNHTMGGNLTIPNSCVLSANIGVSGLRFTSGGTVTSTQASGSSRAISNFAALPIKNDLTVAGTISHFANFHGYSPYSTTATNLTFTNFYHILLNDSLQYTGIAITNKWGIYQEGATDNNHFNGKVLIKTTTDAGYELDVNGTSRANKFQLSALNTAPATSSSTGTLGEIRIDANHIYICTATNTWKRVAIATF